MTKPITEIYSVYNRDTGRLIGTYSTEEIKEIGFKSDNYIVISIPSFIGIITN